MADFVAVLKTLVVPAAISLLIYLLASYVLFPLWQHYRGRYSRYLPLENININININTQTLPLRQRLQNGVGRFLLPSSWRSNYQATRFSANAESGSDGGFDEDDGEELYEVDENRREALSLDARRGQDDDGRRLSRDLEEGFRDDSDEELDDRIRI